MARRFGDHSGSWRSSEDTRVLAVRHGLFTFEITVAESDRQLRFQLGTETPAAT